MAPRLHTKVGMVTVGGLLLGAMLATPAPANDTSVVAPFDGGQVEVRVTVTHTAPRPALRDPFTGTRRAAKRRLQNDQPLRDPFAAPPTVAVAPEPSVLRDPFGARPSRGAPAPAPAPAPSTPLHDPFHG